MSTFSMREGAGVWWALLLCMLAALLAPIMLVELPPLADYPNHLARGFILAFNTQDPALRKMFAPDWALIPNLATDLLLPPLMHVLPPFEAGNVVVSLTVLLPITGSIALSRACFGRFSVWQLCAGFLAYNAMFLLGFINFQIAIGIALWGTAAWVAMRKRLIAAALVGAVFGLVTWVCHLYGFLYFALLIGSAELAAFVNGPRTLATALRQMAALGTALAVPVVLYFATALSGTGGRIVWQGVERKLLYLVTPVLAYSRALALLVGGVLVLALVLWVLRRRLSVAPLAWFAVPALLVAFAVLPVGAKGAYWIDTRVPLLLALVLAATTMPRLPGREAKVTLAVLSALFLGRMAYITEVWRSSAVDIRDVRTVLASVTSGSRVLTVDAAPSRHPTKRDPPRSRVLGPGFPLAYWHYGALALIDRRAFWSDAFTLRGQQPVVARPPYDTSGDGGASAPPDYTDLASYVDKAKAPDPQYYLSGWPTKFDYVLLLNAEAATVPAGLMPEQLELLDHQGIASLYRVRSPATPADVAPQ